MARSDSTSRLRAASAVVQTAALAAALAGLVVGAASSPAVGQVKARPAGSLRAADLIGLAGRFAQFSDDLPAAGKLGVEKITAYEENRHFVYVRGSGTFGDRRMVFCKPATFVVDDLASAGGHPWRLICGSAPKIAGRRFTVTEGEAVVSGQGLLPDGSGIKADRAEAGDRPGAHVVEVAGRKAAGKTRFLHVLQVGGKGAAAPDVKLAEKGGTVTLELAVGDRTLTLVLPSDRGDPGTIAVAQADGRAALPERLLPAGVLPHGAKGVQMLERWDRPYRGRRRPGWDTGRPASELRRAVETGAVRPGRALVLGCGTGTNAIYLASKGFDVTGVDIAPAALKLAEQQARKAKVRVRWLVADALAVPAVGPFDFIFDRGCYHHVRLVDAKGYAETVNAASKPGSLMLLLAANANESRHYGPPRASEAHLVRDFAGGWAFVSLKETRFDGRNPNTKGGLWAWSLLMRRRAPTK